MLDDRQEPAATHSQASDLHDESGAIRADIVAQVAAAIEANDRAVLANLVGDWHEADLGDLLAALDPPLRPRLIELLAARFNFKALTEIDHGMRADILEQLAPAALIVGVRELETDDAVAIEHRRDDGHIGRVVLAGLVGMVDDEGVAGLGPPLKAPPHLAHRERGPVVAAAAEIGFGLQSFQRQRAGI